MFLFLTSYFSHSFFCHGNKPIQSAMYSDRDLISVGAVAEGSLMYIGDPQSLTKNHIEAP